MRRAGTAMVVLLTAGVGPLPAQPAQPVQQVTGEQVQAAIDKGVAYLRAQQGADGAWPDMGRPGGVTCLAALARKGWAFLRGGQPVLLVTCAVLACLAVWMGAEAWRRRGVSQG